jgi:hypothetical protein
MIMMSQLIVLSVSVLIMPRHSLALFYFYLLSAETFSSVSCNLQYVALAIHTNLATRTLSLNTLAI